jgi:hypothetical protein
MMGALTTREKTLIFELLGETVLPKPKVVTRDDLGNIRDADVHVSRADPNSASGQDKVVEVRRPDWVTVNIPAWEQQQAEKRAEREWRHNLDPYKLGLYGPTDDEE